jgi:hypothetical protein
MMAYEWFKHFKNGRASTDDDDADWPIFNFKTEW